MVAPSLVTPSYDLLYLKRAALLCLTSFTHGSGSTWIESGQALLFYLDDVCEGSPDWHARLFNFHWSWPWCQGILPLLGWHLLCTSWQLWATRYRIIGSMAFYELLKMLWEPGFLSYAPGSESAHMFHLSHFHRLVSFCWFGFGCWGGFVCFAFAFFLSTDQSVRSSCQPMTSLAYFHDCHCRYDERSIVQKKNNGDSWRISLKLKGQAGIRSLSEKSQPDHPWSFRVNKRSSSTCIPKSGKKNKSFPLNLPAIRKIYLWEYERRGSRVANTAWVSMLPVRAGSMIRLLVAWWYVRVLLSTSGCTTFGHLPFGLLCLKRVALRCLTPIHSWKLECLDSSCSSTSAFFGWCAYGLHQIGAQGFPIYVATAWDTAMMNCWITLMLTAR